MELEVMRAGDFRIVKGKNSVVLAIGLWAKREVRTEYV
jgi:hypothetical protein